VEVVGAVDVVAAAAFTEYASTGEDEAA